MKVLVIPEDPTHNGHILKPLVKALLADAGRPAARVQILENPRIQGYDEARRVIMEELLERYRWLDIWLFLPDADRANADAMRRLESDLKDIPLFCCPARPEVEIYACAAFRSDMTETWDEARRNPRMKEEVFQPLIERHGDQRRPDGGRGPMINQSLRNLQLMFQLCPELQRLRDRIAALSEQ